MCKQFIQNIPPQAQKLGTCLFIAALFGICVICVGILVCFSRNLTHKELVIPTQFRLGIMCELFAAVHNEHKEHTVVNLML
mmetsp:Transcript_18609/g.31384  ORF Transcript_18609/g.31384 Transcript_18609/m.31384 type:complete len:81 (-) Transcript_18609:483-725(-)